MMTLDNSQSLCQTANYRAPESTLVRIQELEFLFMSGTDFVVTRFLAHFKRSQFGTDLRQGSSFSDFFYSVYFAIDLNGEMLIGQNEPHDYSADVGLKKMQPNCPSVKRNY